jgi:hypothetical protein
MQMMKVRLAGCGAFVLIAVLLVLLASCQRNQAAAPAKAVPSAATATAPSQATPLRIGETLFADDFQQGLNAAWNTTHTWSTSGGVLWHGYDGQGVGYAYVLQGAAWSDYVVDVDINPGLQGAGVILRCQGDLMNYVLLRGDSGSLRFQVMVNGGIAAESNQVRPGFFAGTQHVRVVAKGSTYTLLVNDLQRLVFTDAAFRAGMPGLASFGNYGGEGPLTSGVSFFDNFRVSKLE